MTHHEAMNLLLIILHKVYGAPFTGDGFNGFGHSFGQGFFTDLHPYLVSSTHKDLGVCPQVGFPCLQDGSLAQWRKQDLLRDRDPASTCTP